MKNVYEVLDQKERELMNARMDLSALMRVAPLLTDPGDCLEALKALQEQLEARLEKSIL